MVRMWFLRAAFISVREGARGRGEPGEEKVTLSDGRWGRKWKGRDIKRKSLPQRQFGCGG